MGCVIKEENTLNVYTRAGERLKERESIKLFSFLVWGRSRRSSGRWLWKLWKKERRTSTNL